MISTQSQKHVSWMKWVHQSRSFFRIQTVKLVEWKQSSAFLDGFHSTNYHTDSGRRERLGSLTTCSVPCTLQKYTQTKPFSISIAICSAFDVFDLVIRPLDSGIGIWVQKVGKNRLLPPFKRVGYVLKRSKRALFG